MKQVKVKQDEVPEGWSTEAADFINQLIQRKPANRLGCNGPDEVKSHSWFNEYDWAAISSKSVPSPFVPPKGDNFDANCEWRDQNTDIIQKQIELERDPNIQALFSGYYYMPLLDGNNGAGIVIPDSKAEENQSKPAASSDKTTRSNSFIK